MLKLKALFLGLTAVLMAAVAPGDEAIPNWPAPATWSPHGVSRGVSTMGAITSPLPFIGVTPCRVVDTRNPVGPFGGPAFTSGLTRSFTIPSGPCSGIPIAGAYSLNFTVVTMTGFGFLTAWPTGTAQPLVSTLDYVVAEGALANAAIVPASGIGAISVFVSIGTDVIIDINGYYAPAGVGTHNTFLGLDAGNFTMTGDNNTGVGHNALFSNTTGVNNTAIGHNALVANDTGSHNAAIGTGALASNTGGTQNTASGSGALLSNLLGNNNTASGSGALLSNTGGIQNTATGSGALLSNVSGNDNTAIGYNALFNTTGFGNIGIGFGAGVSLTTGSNNICIGNSGVAGESSTIRIGTVGTQTATFIAGISGVSLASGSAVFISSSGQLGTSLPISSRRFKQDIRDIADESDSLMRLRPVVFKYKPELDPTGLTQYGLIAEEVVQVYPHLVGYDQDGQLRTVHYNLINALMLNEVQKQHRTVEAQEKTIEQQKAEIEGLKARMSRLEARLLAESRP